ncbi:HD domain-containing protein [Simkania negevensis]|uniref:Uncharacterized protein MJ1154 n=1 Tax=Simkania negevensis (strain ATCC VR-1471 / DSM 27360 / Z) TaxID=331113 RepID=F8L4Y3_SIMNZ|nr:HD domain-containing protein [Simkania negevensis]CCB89104.1 uncharacterized protein MJ1154 [Simkania negevensis Z]
MGSIKKIYDSVHRFIHVDPLESDLINSRPFQRLHYIHQLGVTYFVYPGGTHRRFEHSLGVMELATRMYDEVTMGDTPVHLPEPYKKLLADFVPPIGSQIHRYWRRILRLAALCHDLGHLPFSHTAEHEILGKGGHEAWTSKIIRSLYLAPIWATLQEEYPKHNVQEDVLKIALGEKKFTELFPFSKGFSPWERVVTAMITGDFFGSDRIDYLLRDSKCTGLAYGLFDYHQLIEMLKIIPSKEDSEVLALGVEENGIESCEALLLARHYMHKRLYQYASVKSYSFHLARFMGGVYYDLGEELERYISMTDNEVLAELNRASMDPDHPGHFDAKCLYLRQSRFRAISLVSPTEERDLEEIRKELGIPKDQMAWQLVKSGEGRQGLDFPVLRQDGTIDNGMNLTEISIPSGKRSWVYIAPEYEIAVRKNLNLIDDLGMLR